MHALRRRITASSTTQAWRRKHGRGTANAVEPILTWQFAVVTPSGRHSPGRRLVYGIGFGVWFARAEPMIWLALIAWFPADVSSTACM